MARKVSKDGLKKKCDVLWSRLTKAFHRAKYGDICLWCKKQEDLQSDHIVNRWKHSTRWNLSNCVCLCVGCHIFRKKREPLEWARMVMEEIGEETYQELKRLGNERFDGDLEQVYSYLSNIEKERPWDRQTTC